MDGMKVKLIKLENGEYDLLVDTNVKSLEGTKLSLTNCQAIERGYDLDELATEQWGNVHRTGVLGFIDGFQKALELMGDKKFTEEDMFRMFTYGHALTNAIKLKAIEDKPFGEIFNDFIQSLQQTEWDVGIEMERVESYKDKMGNVRTGKTFPKLDADGCLILKLKLACDKLRGAGK